MCPRPSINSVHPGARRRPAHTGPTRIPQQSRCAELAKWNARPTPAALVPCSMGSCSADAIPFEAQRHVGTIASSGAKAGGSAHGVTLTGYYRAKVNPAHRSRPILSPSHAHVHQSKR